MQPLQYVHRQKDKRTHQTTPGSREMLGYCISRPIWPMPTSKHMVVVQDLASRFPAAKLVTSTKADKVLPALSEIYATYGNPEVQISDNGPPFNSAQMHDFAMSKSIKLQKAPPLHPSSNFPLGKAMKIAYQTRAPEKETLERTLNNYRHTPHPATGIPPAAMMFRDGQRYDFPRTYATEEDVRRAREADKQKRIDNEEKINSSKYRKKSNFNIGDKVRVRNYQNRGSLIPFSSVNHSKSSTSMTKETNSLSNSALIF